MNTEHGHSAPLVNVIILFTRGQQRAILIQVVNHLSPSIYLDNSLPKACYMLAPCYTCTSFNLIAYIRILVVNETKRHQVVRGKQEWKSR